MRVVQKGDKVEIHDNSAEKNELQAKGQTLGTLSHENAPARISTIRWVVSLVSFAWAGRASWIGGHNRNDFLLGVLTLAEGWHHSHHAASTRR